MKYSNILIYKKIVKYIKYTSFYIITLLTSFKLSMIYMNPIIFFIGIAVGGITAIPTYIAIEKEIKEMEILLKLEEKINKEEDN